ncbi:hypothetical protein C5Y96_14935 [Blastopirellula marina]|uniref:Uncharacterized protein n=2 Tax=Pirellulales TaxID=2691354 RepID=A0A2S8FEZ6_9BACT|nr:MULTISPECIES: hypothetical protein [Pirellulaceae]PQO30751.1 hypothetical protein C5Y96_14935 [Blastopirellula marina]RCS50888.1 hypothetical protein DTL36_14945 [Bremerella cremea]
MNLFCSNRFREADEVKDLLQCRNLWPRFFVPAPIEKRDGNGDPTTIDVVIDDTFVQASLSEINFTKQRLEVVENYLRFHEVFQDTGLPQHNGSYLNFRVIRNLLAASQNNKRHILLGDQKRPDLAESYLRTVAALKDKAFRSRCRIVYWQELLRVIDPNLRRFVETRFNLVS